MEDLEHSLRRNALPGPHGMPALALTEWSLEWSFQVRRREKDCRVVHAVTRLSTTVTLPRWVDAARAPASLEPVWEGISDALSDHEQGHVAIAHEADAAVAAALSELPPEATCGAAYRAAQHLAEAIAFGYRLRDKAYDRETRNGRAQLQAALRRQ